MLNSKASERRPERRFWVLGLLLGLTALLFAGFCALGVWQIERRAWKLDLIERVDARVHADPVPAPGPAAWSGITAASDEYRRVFLTGHYLNDRETLVQALTERGGGFWVLTPFQTNDGPIVLVNRGFVQSDKRDPSSRARGQIEGETTVIGLLRISEPKGGFLRTNDPAADRWFSRDVAAIAQKRDLDNAAPFFVDAQAVQLPQAPVGGLTVLRFNNTHLIYALTWFGLALLMVVAAYYLVREDRRARRGP
ncbi:SURF1 family protein [Tianweitania sp. BSSL-BM11]|uniref:SURF1-like protein n=1 Tax=Tianweitania aestuarii TaxID=2814886 RepID=A0ABS5RQR4_9HYPH|nr:SURF1 family protein [Tianweitania aestuarii]MBS9719302.1 SURF1 family protein [Tianweitania aestuarii]